MLVIENPWGATHELPLSKRWISRIGNWAAVKHAPTVTKDPSMAVMVTPIGLHRVDILLGRVCNNREETRRVELCYGE